MCVCVCVWCVPVCVCVTLALICVCLSLIGSLGKWAISPEERNKHDQMFDTLLPAMGYITGKHTRTRTYTHTHTHSHMHTHYQPWETFQKEIVMVLAHPCSLCCRSALQESRHGSSSCSLAYLARRWQRYGERFTLVSVPSQTHCDRAVQQISQSIQSSQTC